MSSEWLGHQNSDQNPSKISQEFRGHLVCWSEYYLILGIFLSFPKLIRNSYSYDLPRLSGPHFKNKITVIFKLKFNKIPILGLMAENPFGLVMINHNKLEWNYTCRFSSFCRNIWIFQFGYHPSTDFHRFIWNIPPICSQFFGYIRYSLHDNIWQ